MLAGGERTSNQNCTRERDRHGITAILLGHIMTEHASDDVYRPALVNFRPPAQISCP